MDQYALLFAATLNAGTVLAIASNFQQAGLVAGTDGGKAGFITALYVVLVPLLGFFFGQRPARGDVIGAVAAAATSPQP